MLFLMKFVEKVVLRYHLHAEPTVSYHFIVLNHMRINMRSSFYPVSHADMYVIESRSTRGCLVY